MIYIKVSVAMFQRDVQFDSHAAVNAAAILLVAVAFRTRISSFQLSEVATLNRTSILQNA